MPARTRSRGWIGRGRRSRCGGPGERVLDLVELGLALDREQGNVAAVERPPISGPVFSSRTAGDGRRSKPPARAGRQTLAGPVGIKLLRVVSPRCSLPAMQYRPQWDSLRALAVAGVLFSHFWMPASFAGSLGVQVFFVLSGFLITSILLQRPLLGTFFRRRALRLLPAFYIAVLGALVFNLPGMRDSWPWHVLQASNFYFALNNSWATPWPANHLWSLNVEEQFYVIWPLVLLLPRAWLPWAIGCFIVAAPIFRNLAPGAWAETMPIASFDALAGGGLIALFPRRIFYLGFAAAPVVMWGPSGMASSLRRVCCLPLRSYWQLTTVH